MTDVTRVAADIDAANAQVVEGRKRFLAITRFSTFFLIDVVSRAVSLLTVPIFTRFLSPADYGLASSCLAVAAVIPLIFYLCAHELIYFEALRGKPWSDPAIKSTSTFLLVMALAGIILACIPLAFSGSFPAGFPYFPLGFLTALIGILSVFNPTVLRYLQAVQSMRLYSVLSLAFLFCVVGVRLLFVTVLNYGAAGLLLGDVTGHTLMLAVAVGALFRTKGLKNVQAGEVRRSIAFGMPLIVHNLAHWGRFQIFVLLLSVFATTRQAGFFYIAMAYTAPLTMILEAWKSLMNPRIFDFMRDPQRNAKKLESLVGMCLGLMTGAAALAILIFPLLIGRIIAADFATAWRFVPLLGASQIGFVPYFTIVSTLFYDSKTSSIAKVTSAASVVGILAAYLGMQLWSVEGAAIGTIVTSFCMSLYTLIWSRRKHSVKWPLYPTLIAMTSIVSFYFLEPYSLSFWLLMIGTLMGAAFSFLASQKSYAAGLR